MNKSNRLVALVFIVSTLAPLATEATSYYVNDSFAVGDVYTVSLGHDLNTGLAPHFPKATLQSVFDSYDVEPGDTIYVDTGLYATSTNTVVTGSDGGDASNAVSIIGSPNVAQGGTVFDRNGAAKGDGGLKISGATNVLVQHIQVRSWGSGFLVVGGSTACALIQCRAESNGVAGVMLEDENTSVLVQNCVFVQQYLQAILVLAGSLDVENCTLSNSEIVGIHIDGGELRLNNSIVISRGFASCCIWISGGTYFGNNNNLAHDANQFVGFIDGPGPVPSLADWQAATGQDADSLSHDPLLADESAGDMHLQSLAGRFDPATGAFVLDSQHSPAIDAGSPASPFANEPAPNGGRNHQGAYGNTAEASKSRTNSALLAVSYNDGGTAQGVVTLHWLATGPASAGTVRLEYSADDGQTWELIAANVPASAGTVQWDTFLHRDGGTGVWRVISETEPGVMSETAARFTVASGPRIVAPTPSGMVLQWFGQSGHRYRVMSTTTGLDGEWAPCPNLIYTNGHSFGIATGANANIVVIDTNYDVHAKSFYAIGATDP